MGSRPRVAAIGIFHETNTFAEQPTTLADFAARGIMAGRAWIDAFARTRTVGGGFIDGAAAHDLELCGVFGAYATPSGTITDAAAAALLDRLAEQLAVAGVCDAVLLELHGAAVAADHRDFEAEVVSMVANALPDRPIVAVLDLHANMRTPRFPELAALIGYRTNPHIDTYDRGRQAAGLVATILRTGDPLRRAHRGIACMAIPSAQGTANDPLRTILARARALESQCGLADISVHAGYAYADVEHLGMGFTANAATHRQAEAERAVAELAGLAHDLVGGFAVDVPTPEEALAAALSHRGLSVIADTGDNINGGAPGDGTWLLHLARARPAARSLTTVWDPRTIELAAGVGEGAELEVELGGHSGALSGRPLRGPARVRCVADGVFTNKGPMATGARVDMGRAVLLSVGGLDVVVQQRPIQPNDPEMFFSLGVDPAEYDVAILKGAAALRAGWEGVATMFVDAATPGPCDADLDRLTYRRAQRVSDE